MQPTQNTVADPAVTTYLDDVGVSDAAGSAEFYGPFPCEGAEYGICSGEPHGEDCPSYSGPTVVIDPVTTSTVAPSEAAIKRLTPAGVLRAAAGYLHQFGWFQGDLFDDPDRSTPCACPVGAIRMAVIGTPEVAVEHLRSDVLAQFDAAVAVLADHLIDEHDALAPVAPLGVLFPGDLEQVVARWNDHPNRNVGQVLAALNGAADEWDRIHNWAEPGAPGRPGHVDYSHWDGTRSDCAGCTSTCFCDEDFECVHCVLLAGGTWANPSDWYQDDETDPLPTLGGVE